MLIHMYAVCAAATSRRCRWGEATRHIRRLGLLKRILQVSAPSSSPMQLRAGLQPMPRPTSRLLSAL